VKVIYFNEVQRIKNTVEKIKDGKKYFVLIDELFIRYQYPRCDEMQYSSY